MGRTVVVRSKGVDDLALSYLAIGLKQAGVDPSTVNLVVQSDADLTKMFLEGATALGAVRRGGAGEENDYRVASDPVSTFGAEDGTRTRDPHLGKVMLYQLSHFRVRPEHPNKRIIPLA